MTPEFSRPVAAASLGRRGAEITVEASAAECAALALRLGIVALRGLRCRFSLAPLPGGAVAAQGQLRAEVTQDCVVTLEPFDSVLEEAFSVRFVADEPGEDIDPESEDEIPYDGATIDLGEAAAEQLALGLDPYPRRPGAALEEETAAPGLSPFSALRRP